MTGKRLTAADMHANFYDGNRRKAAVAANPPDHVLHEPAKVQTPVDLTS